MTSQPFGGTPAEIDATIHGAQTVIDVVEAVLTDLRATHRLDVAIDEVGFHIEQAIAAYETDGDVLAYASRVEQIASEPVWKLARQLGLGCDRDLIDGDEIRAEYLNGVVGAAFTQISDVLLEHAYRVRGSFESTADAA